MGLINSNSLFFLLFAKTVKTKKNYFVININ